MVLEREGSLQDPEVLRRLVANEAVKWLGVRSILYQDPNQGVTPEGFDCSGFVQFVLQKVGVPLSAEIRHTNEFFDSFGVLVHWPFQKSGDLVFFSRNGDRPTHMGIVLDSQRFIHAPGTDGSEVEIDQLRIKPIRANSEKVIYATNPIGFKRISIGNGRWKRF